MGIKLGVIDFALEKQWISFWLLIIVSEFIFVFTTHSHGQKFFFVEVIIVQSFLEAFQSFSKGFAPRSAITAQILIILDFWHFYYWGIIPSKVICSFIRLRFLYCCQLEKVQFIKCSGNVTPLFSYSNWSFFSAISFVEFFDSSYFPCQARCVIVD